MVYVLILVFMMFLDWKFDTHVFMTVMISPIIILAVSVSVSLIAERDATVEIVDTREFTSGDFLKGSSATSSSKFSCVTSDGLEEFSVEQATFKKSDRNIITEQKLKSTVFYKVLFFKFDKTHYIVEVKNKP